MIPLSVVCLCLIAQGQTFVAINPEMFASGFTGRMSQFMDEIRALEPVRPTGTAVAPWTATPPTADCHSP